MPLGLGLLFTTFNLIKLQLWFLYTAFLLCKMHIKFIIVTILSVQSSGIKYIHNIVQPLPLSISLTYHPRWKLHTH